MADAGNEQDRSHESGSGAESSGAVTEPVVSLKLMFGLTTGVSRRSYLTCGLVLMAFKYTVEWTTVRLVTDRSLSVLEFLSPVISARENLVNGVEWLGWAWFIWTLPFLWVAVSMSVRRSLTSGHSAWYGLLIFVPGVNLLTMLILALLPNRTLQLQPVQRVSAEQSLGKFRSAAIGLLAGVAIAGVMLLISVYAFDVYGAALFLGTPVIMGAVANVVSNSVLPRSWSASMNLGMLSVLLAGGALLAFAFEGIICIAMAAPIALPLGALGGVIGKLIADSTVRPLQGTLTVLFFLPGWAGYERIVSPATEFLVSSTVVIDASPEQVWNSVIHFPDLDPPEEWYFRSGIACPIRAEIRGEGVGAVRHCIFTTGTFVEPITVWDEPRRLAFDVKEQPAPMFEMSPWKHVHPPHLDGALKSNRGEFVLHELPDGRTRLTGNTWYSFDMYPHTYWTLWSDLLIHRIHRRVLDHVKQHAESDTTTERVGEASPTPSTPPHLTYRLPDQQGLASSALRWKLGSPEENGFFDPNRIAYDRAYMNAYEDWAINEPIRCGAATYTIITEQGEQIIQTGQDEQYLGSRFRAEDLVRFLRNRCEGKSGQYEFRMDEQSRSTFAGTHDLSTNRLDRSPWARDTASILSLIGLAKHQPALPWIKRLLRDPDAGVRYASAMALGQLASVMPEAMQELASLFPDDQIGAVALEAVAGAGTAAIPVLTAVLGKNSRDDCQRIIGLLPWLSVEVSLPVLLVALDHESSAIRGIAANSALEMQTRNHAIDRQEVIDVLKKRANDPTDLEETKRIAGLILDQIKPVPSLDNRP